MISRTRQSYMGRDLDAYMDVPFARSLAELSDVPSEQLLDRTYSAHSIRLTAIDQPKSGGRRWILPKVNKNRRPTGAWLQFCIRCVQGDRVPYMRRRWRYAFLTTCEIHGVALVAHCPFCACPFDFEGYDIDLPQAEIVVPISVCRGCRQDVRQSHATPGLVDIRIVRYERALCAAVERGCTRVRGTGWVYSHQVLDVLHRLLRLLHTKNGLQQLFLRYVATCEGPESRFAVPAGKFESWPLGARHRAVAWLSNLLRGWPENFIDQCTRFHVLRSSIHGHRGTLPYWFDRVLRDRLYRPWYRASFEEVASTRDAIRRAGQPDAQYNLRRWLGRYCQDARYVRRLAAPSPTQLEERSSPLAYTRGVDDPSREQFEHVRPLLEQVRKRTKTNSPELYDVWCAVLYRVRTGCSWASLPGEFPKPATVYWYFVRWGALRHESVGLLEQALWKSNCYGPYLKDVAPLYS